jgi:glycosyltransferase involved in cell wall biosynthesis
VSRNDAPSTIGAHEAVKVALVHDYLTQRGGAERVFLSMCRAFPDAPIYTSLYEPDLTFPEFAEFDIHTTSLNAVRMFRRHHRLALPFLAAAFSRLEIDADVTLCSSSGWAHGATARGAKVVYCHNPARWLYQTAQYTGRSKVASLAAARLGSRPLRRWDYRAGHSADAYLVNSRVVRRRVRAIYGFDADVVEPPITMDPKGTQSPVEGVHDGFFLCVSRLLRYKNVEAIIEAFANLPDERLVIVGSGPMESHLKSMLPWNVELVGSVDESELRWLYAKCRALVAASYEDFGLTPVEAMAFGKPSAVLRYGGFLETVIEYETGVFFDTPTAPAIRHAVGELQQKSFVPDLLTKRSEEYSQARFGERLHSAVASVTTERDLPSRQTAHETASD